MFLTFFFFLFLLWYISIFIAFSYYYNVDCKEKTDLLVTCMRSNIKNKGHEKEDAYICPTKAVCIDLGRSFVRKMGE